jgi:DNA polymerase-1
LPDINSQNAVVRGFAERNAINAPIQGSAADIIKLAMVNILKRFDQENIKSKMILQVHDELNFDVLISELEIVKQLIIDEMQNAVSIDVPLLVETGSGKNWLEAH